MVSIHWPGFVKQNLQYLQTTFYKNKQNMKISANSHLRYLRSTEHRSEKKPEIDLVDPTI